MEIKKNLIELRKQAEVKTNDIINQSMLLAFNMAEESLLRKSEAIQKVLENPTAKEIYYSSLGKKFDKLNEMRLRLYRKSQHYINAALTIYKLNQEINRISNNI